jgi:hypothetical protein
VPVKKDGKVLGVLAAAFDKEPAAGVCALMMTLSEQVGDVLIEARRAAEGQEAVAQAAEALRGEVTRLSLGRAASSDRVALSRRLARTLGMSREDAGWVAWAAALDATEVAIAGTKARRRNRRPRPCAGSWRTATSGWTGRGRRRASLATRSISARASWPSPRHSTRRAPRGPRPHPQAPGK